MGLKDKLRRLEKASGGLYRTLTLPDGTRVRYRPEELLEAVAASVRRREHRLLPHIRKVGGYRGMVGLVKRLEESRRKADE